MKRYVWYMQKILSGVFLEQHYLDGPQKVNIEKLLLLKL